MNSSTATILSDAAAVARSHLGPGVALADPELLKDASRAVVLRCRVAGAGGTPASLIVKAIRDDEATGYAEWASLAFLSALPAARGLAPRFVGGDVGRCLFLLEDLGAGQTLDDVLTGGTRGEAEAMLGELARQMARLHTATLGCEAEFMRLRAALPGATGHGRAREAESWRAAHGRIVAWFAAAGVPAPAGFDRCLERIAARYAEPGEWLAFSHGDPAPSNNHTDGRSVRLLDFEYGAFRHALYDITAWDVLCPLPAPAVALMRRAFQETLAGGLGSAGDEARFAEEWALLCAYRALAIATWIDPAALHANRPFVGAWTARHALLAALGRLHAATAAFDALSPVAEAAERLGRALRGRWTEFGDREIATEWPALAA
jgi:hypothetical protein